MMNPVSTDVARPESPPAADHVPGLNLRIDWSTGPDGECFAVAGELDLRTGPELREAVMATEEPAPRVVRLDLSAVSFMDSTGLEALVDLRRSLDGSGGRLVLTAVSQRVLRILQVTRLEGFFGVTAPGA